jgi:hypothetical protein
MKLCVFAPLRETLQELNCARNAHGGGLVIDIQLPLLG